MIDTRHTPASVIIVPSSICAYLSARVSIGSTSPAGFLDCASPGDRLTLDLHVHCPCSHDVRPVARVRAACWLAEGQRLMRRSASTFRGHGRSRGERLDNGFGMLSGGKRRPRKRDVHRDVTPNKCAAAHKGQKHKLQVSGFSV